MVDHVICGDVQLYCCKTLAFNLWLTWLCAIFIKQIKNLRLSVSLQFKIYHVVLFLFLANKLNET